MPFSPATPIPASAAPHVRAAFELIDRRSDPWHLPNWKVSILGDAAIYIANERIRESVLNAHGITTREHGAVREALRTMMTCERTDSVRFRRLASILVGERRLAGARGLPHTLAVARRFAPLSAAAR